MTNHRSSRWTGAGPHGPAVGVAHGLWVRAPVIAIGLAAAIPVVNSTIRAVRAGWVPAGDDGIIATRGWDVLSSHTPLVGQYSEAGLVLHGGLTHSPGPMLYWLIAMPARFGGVTSIAVAMGAVNTLAIVGCVALAARRGGLVLAFATAIGIALMCQSLPTEAMHDVWNPAAGLFPFLLLIFVCWSLACGEHRLLPLAALLASFVTQTHLMYVAPTAVLLAVACGGLLIRSLERRRARGGPGGPRSSGRVWPWAVVALVLAGACWAGPAIDQIENDPGNLAMIVRTAEHRGRTLGPTVGWNAVAHSLGGRPWWLYVPATAWDRKVDVRRAPTTIARDSTIALLLALVAAGLIGLWARRRDVLTGALIGLGLCVAIGFEGASNPSTRLLAGTLGYTMWWGSELGFWVWLILAWALWLGLVALSRPAWQALYGRRRDALPSRTRPVAIGLAGVVCLGGVVAVASAVAGTAKSDSHVYEYRPIRALATGIEQAIPPGATIGYRFGPLGPGTQPMEPAIRYLLVRRGDRVLARGSYVRLGSYYERCDCSVGWILYLTDGTRTLPHMRLVARTRFAYPPWGMEVLSAWVRRLPPSSSAAVRRW